MFSYKGDKSQKVKKTNGFAMFLFEYKRLNNLEMGEAQFKAGEAWGVSSK